MQFLFPVLMFAAAWFLLVRPQQARARAQKSLISSLTVGDEIVTVGGLRGRVVRLDDAEAVIDAGGGVELTYLRGAVSARLPRDGEVVAGDGPEATDEDRL